jgi:hypothetical protein
MNRGPGRHLISVGRLSSHVVDNRHNYTIHLRVRLCCARDAYTYTRINVIRIYTYNDTLRFTFLMQAGSENRAWRIYRAKRGGDGLLRFFFFFFLSTRPIAQHYDLRCTMRIYCNVFMRSRTTRSLRFGRKRKVPGSIERKINMNDERIFPSPLWLYFRVNQ